MRAAEKTATTEEMLAAVKRHAREHYEINGWDILVECWDDAEILKHIGKARTVNGALTKVYWVVKTIAGVRQDVRNA